ncbi:MAG: AraC family transcriptional regulator [Alteromonadaceae bacterium]|nr:AraC family transcriptional regulator [Alteromonadaceae bacterium]|tara:strand:+ start:34 stop:1050 length:1017 start_codon:yes stop_codon:yes gene_type:complete
MSEDVLSGLLRRVRLRGALFFNVECVGAWVTEAPLAALIANVVMPASEHLMEYHVVLGGRCWAGITGEPAFEMAAGDVVLFPHGDAHVLASAPGLRAEPNLPYLIAGLKQRKGLPFMVRQLDDKLLQPTVKGVGTPSPPVATLLCGFLGCDRAPFNPLLSALPRVIHARASELSEDSWTGQLARLAEAESRSSRPGGEAVLERMSEMMFVDLVRHYLSTLPPSHTGWLSALRDSHVGRALRLMHSRPAEAWTLERLSGDVGLSRSALQERFAELLGQAPMQYLRCWRMQVASNLLVESNAKIATIARDVGYESEEAFSRSFKRIVGEPPAAWRRDRSV